MEALNMTTLRHQNRVKIFHKNQKTFEYYEFKHGAWLPVDEFTADNWEVGSYDFHELIHNYSKNSASLYGRYYR